MRKRDSGIDILKCLAALLITWSHMDVPLGKYAVLATGGAFGDSMFFFCSGFTLFYGNKPSSFLNWYKKRISRIYPTVFAWAIIRAFLLNSRDNMVEIILSGGGFFVSCIMLFYIPFYFIKKYFFDKLRIVLMLSIVFTSCSFFLIDSSNPVFFYRWLFTLYFNVMLLGGIIGDANKDVDKTLAHSKIVQIMGLMLSVFSYYIIEYAEQLFSIQFFKAFTIIPLLGFSYSIYALCKRISFERCENTPPRPY